jgi:hypothetical protein
VSSASRVLHLSFSAGYVSAKEAHSAVALSEILGYSVADDRERPAGLRLVEWLRGYAFLQCLAEDRFKTTPTGVIILEESELAAGLQRVGLSADAARIFIGHATLGRLSRDMYEARGRGVRIRCRARLGRLRIRVRVQEPELVGLRPSAGLLFRVRKRLECRPGPPACRRA